MYKNTFLVPWIRQAEITVVNIETMRKTTPKVNIPDHDGYHMIDHMWTTVYVDEYQPEEAACSCSSISSFQSSSVLSMFSFQPGVITSISLSASA